MHPILFHLGPINLYSYGVLIALGILLASAWLVKRCKAFNLNPDSALTAAVVMVICGFMGARLLYVVYFPHDFLADPIKIIADRGSLVWYGGLIGASLAGVVWLGLKKIPRLVFADAVILPVGLALALGRVGCFMSGCCFGSPCDLPWAVQYPVGHETYPQWLHPTQLYEAAAVLLLVALMHWVQHHDARYQHGRLFALFLMGYAIIRFGIESLRGDALLIGFLSSSQWLSVGAFVIGAILWWAVRRKSQAA